VDLRADRPLAEDYPMLAQLQPMLNLYGILLLVAVPIVVMVFWLATRQDKRARQPAQRPHQRPAAPRVEDGAAPSAPAEMAPPVVDVPTVAQEPMPEALPASAPPPTVALPPGLAAHLLLVDDSAVARTKLRRLFEGTGYSTALAKDGVEALQMLGRGRYALMITDLEMPEMDGIELISIVSEAPETEDMPIIAITGHDALKARVFQYSVLYGIFTKPWNDRELLRRVEALVRVRLATPAAAISP
jgi:CheY-like chemotaxis protein